MVSSDRVLTAFLALRLMGDCGLRVTEVLDICPSHIARLTDGRHYGLEVVAGKDTSGSYSGASIGKRGSPSIWSVILIGIPSSRRSITMSH